MARCVVLGSAGVDEVVRLDEPLRPGAHLQGRPVERRLGGGAANTGVTLAHAGHLVTLVAALGDDPDGDWVLSKLTRAGLDLSAVVHVPGPTTRSLVLLDPDGERTIVNLHRCVEAEPPARLLDLRADVIYVRSRELALAPLLAARLATGLVVAHVPPAEPGARPAHILVASASDLSKRQLRAPWTLGRSVAGNSLQSIVVTRGAAGADAYAPGQRLHAAAPPVEVVDSTGAGDVFAAGLVHALASALPLAQAIELACAWGAAAAATPGLPTREQIQALARHGHAGCSAPESRARETSPTRRPRP